LINHKKTEVEGIHGGIADKKLDYALLCCDGIFNMDVAEASKCAKAIGAKHTIHYHMEPVKDKSGLSNLGFKIV